MQMPFSRQTRCLTVIAQDPFVTANGGILRAQLEVPYETLSPGPRGYRVHVVDYDASSDTLYKAVELDGDEDPFANASDGQLCADPRFHQQNAYAIVMRTLARFEAALGRRVPWGFPSHQLKVVPHAFADANAFYAENEEALLFGYFQGKQGPVYACLSHDIVAHETAHALLDGVRERFTDPSSPDQAAFHEGFADVVALLSVFALPGVVETLLRSGDAHLAPGLIKKARIDREVLARGALLGLAEQMGQEMPGLRGDVLRRSVNIPPSRTLLKSPDYAEAHDRGEVLVAALLNAFLDAWVTRLKKLGEVSPGMVDLSRVVEDGAEAADTLLTMVIRALDYLPPVDLDFSEFLSALLTADREMRPADAKYDYRKVLRDRCRRYGIEPPANADAQGCWQAPPEAVDDSLTHFESLQRSPEEVFRFVWQNRRVLKLDEDAYTHVPYVRPVVRVGPDGFVLRETVAEYIQLLQLEASELARRGIDVPQGMPADQSVTIYGGGTLIFDERGKLKFHVHHSVDDRPKQSRRLEYLWNQGAFGTGARRLRGFANLHRARALPMRRVAEEW